MTLLWLAAYALAVARVGTWLRRPTIRRTLEGVTGAALIGLGLKLAAEQR
jgi:threonine/homoserine/homoserine lactone efflux protein